MANEAQTPLQLRSFLSLNAAMALRALLNQVQFVEAMWEDEGKRRAALDRLLELLDWAALHPSTQVRGLSALKTRMPSEPSYQQFLSLFVPIEREHGRLVSDADFLIRDLDHKSPQSGRPVPGILILDNIRSAFNVGSILRLAECLGFEKVYLCGYTARPDQEKVAKAALGAEQLISWEWHPHCQDLLQILRAQKLPVFALETAARSQRIEATQFPQQRLALLAGNERYGLEPELLRLCQGVIEIPCWGRKNSLNVAVSMGIAAYELRRQWLSSGYLAE